MRPESTSSNHKADRVLHWAGQVTDEVFSFLGPASAAMARAGIEQTVVLIDEPRYRHLLPRFDESITVVLTPALPNRYGRWKRAQESFVAALRDTSPSAVHLHGFVPYMLGMRATRRLARQARVFYSPHGSRSLATPFGSNTLSKWARNGVFSAVDEYDIASSSAEARALIAMKKQRVTLVESAVAPAFLEVERAEGDRPLVVTGNRIPEFRSATMFAQLAVLLSDESVGLRFEWIGGSDSLSESCLKAANVGVSDITDEAERARRLAAAWVYVAPAGKSGFPVFLAEAMAAGLPCVAVDTDYHSDLIEHGVTGYLCRNEEELVSHIAMLIGAPEVRAMIGNAARREAARRFSGRQFLDASTYSAA